MGVEVETRGDILDGVLGRLRELGQSTTIGLHEDAAPYPDGTDVVMVGAIQEFGAGPIPARPFERGYFDSGGAKDMGDVAAKTIGSVVDGRATPLAVGDAVGAEGVAGIRKFIEAGIDPALSEVTLLLNPDRDSRAIPLLDTGHLTGELAAKTEPA